jgi:Flp pilus assembly protein TadD
MSKPNMSADALWSIKHLGHALLERERFDDAEAVFTGLTALSADDPYPWLALGQIARGRGDMTRAQQLIEHATRLAPTDAAAACALAELHIAQQQWQGARAALAPLGRLTPAQRDAPAARRAGALLASLKRR